MNGILLKVSILILPLPLNKQLPQNLPLQSTKDIKHPVLVISFLVINVCFNFFLTTFYFNTPWQIM